MGSESTQGNGVGTTTNGQDETTDIDTSEISDTEIGNSAGETPPDGKEGDELGNHAHVRHKRSSHFTEKSRVCSFI